MNHCHCVLLTGISFKEVGSFQGTEDNVAHECGGTLKVHIRDCCCFVLLQLLNHFLFCSCGYLIVVGKMNWSPCPDESHQLCSPQPSLIKWMEVQQCSRWAHITTSHRLPETDLQCPTVCHNPTIRRNTLVCFFSGGKTWCLCSAIFILGPFWIQWQDLAVWLVNVRSVVSGRAEPTPESDLSLPEQNGHRLSFLYCRVVNVGEEVQGRHFFLPWHSSQAHQLLDFQSRGFTMDLKVLPTVYWAKGGITSSISLSHGIGDVEGIPSPVY